jgi:hypothetical protein
MILHGAINVPTKGNWDFIQPAAMIVVLVLFHKKWRGMVREFLAQVAGKGWKRAAFWGTVVAVTLVIGFETRAEVFVPVALLGLGVALVLEFRQRRRTVWSCATLT